MNINDIPAEKQMDDSMDADEDEQTDIEEQPTPQSDGLRQELDKYFWRKSTTECVQSLVKKASDYYNYINATGKMALWRLCFEQYNRGFITLGSISRGGVEGELLNLPINEFRNVVDHVIGLTTHDKLAFEPQPVNNDYSTAAQVTLAKGILGDYSRTHGMDRVCDKTAENAYIFGEGSVCKLFNENIGDLKFVDLANQRSTARATFNSLN